MSWPKRVTEEQMNKADAERLRDHFAAAAVTGLLSNIPRYQLGVIAVQAYDIADEMLRERVKRSVGVSEMDSEADRKSVAAHGACARPCSQPFDSAPTTSLTDEEREAVKEGAESLYGDGYDAEAAALRKLLERLA